MAKLTTMQHRTLKYLAGLTGVERSDNWDTTEGVARWTKATSRTTAYGKLAALREKGFVEQGGLKSWWRITDAGRAALAEHQP